MENQDELKRYAALKANYREMLKTRAGREVIWHILSLCDIYTDGFTGNSTTFFIAGKRNVGMQLIEVMTDADPTAYPRLLLEHAHDKEDVE
jgi:hypothetical protein